jgi:RNA polymerase sigma-70 factor (ECF subfamily)
MKNKKRPQSLQLQRMFSAECGRHHPEKSVLLACYEGGLYSRHQELAERLGAPLGAVKSWVRRGLARLRECLES